jgi:branched-chain amino acid transport system permease protein
MTMGILSYFIFFGVNVLIFTIATLGLNLQWGFTGLFNAGAVGFYAIGGYALAILTAPAQPELLGNFGMPWGVGVIGAVVASGAVAYLVALATIRLRGDFLAISTFGIALSIQMVALNWDALTGGSQGLAFIPKPLSGLFPTSFGYNLFYLGMTALFTALLFWALERIVRSPWGRVLKAIREDEVAAIALGKDANSFRIQAFVLGSMMIGFAGALYVSFIGFTGPNDFQPIITFQIWTMLIVGGSGSNRGSLLGALVVWTLWTMSGALIFKIVPAAYHTQGGAIQTILIGLVVVLALLFRPRGLIGEEPFVSRHVERPSATPKKEIPESIKWLA